MLQFVDRQSILLCTCVVILGLVVVAGCLGCGGAAAGAASTSSSTIAPVSCESDSLASLMAEIAKAVEPMPVYGWERLPPGARVVEQWWPALDLSSPEKYQGDPVHNPRIWGPYSAERQVQLLLEMGAGWVMLFANLRADLGDTQGRNVGNVAGHAATLYDVNGGRLVQWSDGGRWYGVFGRGVAEDLLVSIALEAQLIDPGNLQSGD